MQKSLSERYRVYDTDSHIIEPVDLWTSRVPARFGDLIPRPTWSEARGEQVWTIGGKQLYGVGTFAMAGWPEFLPGHPPSLEEADPAAWDAKARLARMTEYGIHAQVLYPNLIGFFFGAFLQMNQPELLLSCVRAYNDWLAEYASADPDRFLPMMVLPYWDLDLSLAEMDRCIALGHRGIVAGRLEGAGYPALRDPHWDPIWAAAQERGLPVNFHIGFNVDPDWGDKSKTSVFTRSGFAESSSQMFMTNMQTLAEVIFSGILHRHPTLKVVSVESGAGWLPFFIESMDWQFRNTGVHLDMPDFLLPSEYFMRQVYATFWFERGSLAPALAGLQNNLMFSTDFPHPTSQTPGPASFADGPPAYMQDVLGTGDADIARKVLQDNARHVYQLN